MRTYRLHRFAVIRLQRTGHHDLLELDGSSGHHVTLHHLLLETAASVDTDLLQKEHGGAVSAVIER